MRNLHKQNEYDGVCIKCGGVVPAGKGRLFSNKNPDHKRRGNIEWKVMHLKKRCPKEANNDRL